MQINMPANSLAAVLLASTVLAGVCANLVVAGDDERRLMRSIGEESVAWTGGGDVQNSNGMTGK